MVVDCWIKYVCDWAIVPTNLPHVDVHIMGPVISICHHVFNVVLVSLTLTCIPSLPVTLWRTLYFFQ